MNHQSLCFEFIGLSSQGYLSFLSLFEVQLFIFCLLNAYFLLLKALMSYNNLRKAFRNHRSHFLRPTYCVLQEGLGILLYIIIYFNQMIIFLLFFQVFLNLIRQQDLKLVLDFFTSPCPNYVIIKFMIYIKKIQQITNSS